MHLSKYISKYKNWVGKVDEWWFSRILYMSITKEDCIWQNSSIIFADKHYFSKKIIKNLQLYRLSRIKSISLIEQLDPITYFPNQHLKKYIKIRKKWFCFQNTIIYVKYAKMLMTQGLLAQFHAQHNQLLTA